MDGMLHSQTSDLLLFIVKRHVATAARRQQAQESSSSQELHSSVVVHPVALSLQILFFNFSLSPVSASDWANWEFLIKRLGGDSTNTALTRYQEKRIQRLVSLCWWHPECHAPLFLVHLFFKIQQRLNRVNTVHCPVSSSSLLQKKRQQIKMC